jgi:hypothetical protein
VSARDTFVQLGFLLMSLGAVVATWALLTGPLGKLTGLAPKAARRKPQPKKAKSSAQTATPEDDPGA